MTQMTRRYKQTRLQFLDIVHTILRPDVIMTAKANKIISVKVKSDVHMKEEAHVRNWRSRFRSEDKQEGKR